MSSIRIVVTEPTLVRDQDGQPVGRLQPGRSYRAHAVDDDRVTLKGPDGSLGVVPRSAVTLALDEPAVSVDPPAAAPHAEAVEEPAPPALEPEPEPTKRQLRKQARRGRKQDKRDRRSQAQRELSGATSNPSKVKVSKGGIIVALFVIMLLAGAGAIAVVVATRGQTADPGWWQHNADDELGDGDPSLDLVLLVDEEEQIERGEARYDDGEFCYVAVFEGSGSDPEATGLATTGYGHFCDEETLIEMEIPDLALRDSLLQGDYTTYAVVEGERSIVITEGEAVLEPRGGPDSADRMERPATWAPTSSEGQTARVARVLNPDLGGESATGYIEVILCPFGRLRYWQDQQSNGTRVVGVGAGQVDAELNGTLLVSQQSPGQPASGTSYVVSIEADDVVLFGPDGPVIVPLTNDTTRRCGI